MFHFLSKRICLPFVCVCAAGGIENRSHFGLYWHEC